jgi:hypothetical protein
MEQSMGAMKTICGTYTQFRGEFRMPYHETGQIFLVATSENISLEHKYFWHVTSLH